MQISVELDGIEYERLAQLADELGFLCLHDYLFHVLWCGLMHELDLHGVHDELWPDNVYDYSKETDDETTVPELDDDIPF